jgi:hypothetical protein
MNKNIYQIHDTIQILNSLMNLATPKINVGRKPTGCNENGHYLIITKRLFRILLLVMIETQLRHGI